MSVRVSVPNFAAVVDLLTQLVLLLLPQQPKELSLRERKQLLTVCCGAVIFTHTHTYTHKGGGCAAVLLRRGRGGEVGLLVLLLCRIRMQFDERVEESVSVQGR